MQPPVNVTLQLADALIINNEEQALLPQVLSLHTLLCERSKKAL
jgi:hypothetical protein